jgi:hypothetical protein
MIRSARTKTPISATIQVVAAVQEGSLGPREFGSVSDVLDQLLGAGKSSGKALVAALGGKGGSSDKNEVANYLGWTQQKLQECIVSLVPLVWECGAGNAVCLSGNSVSKLLYTSSAGGDFMLPVQGLPKEISQFGVLAASSNLSSDLAHMITSASTSDRDVALLLDTTAGLALRALQRCGQTRGLVGALGPLVQVASTGRFFGTGDRRAAMLFGLFGSGCPGDEAVRGLVKASIKGSVEARGILAVVLSSWMQASGLTGLREYPDSLELCAALQRCVVCCSIVESFAHRHTHTHPLLPCLLFRFVPSIPPTPPACKESHRPQIQRACTCVLELHAFNITIFKRARPLTMRVRSLWYFSCIQFPSMENTSCRPRLQVALPLYQLHHPLHPSAFPCASSRRLRRLHGFDRRGGLRGSRLSDRSLGQVSGVQNLRPLQHFWDGLPTLCRSSRWHDWHPC